MCLAEAWSTGPYLGRSGPKLVQFAVPEFGFGLVKASGPVDFNGLLVIVIVIPSQLLEEASEHLCGLGAVAKDISMFL